MKRSLLDVNVLLALLDSDHVEHRTAQHWLSENLGGGWASCALTENGFVRVISQSRYPNPVATAQAITLLAGAAGRGDHEAWACDLSVLDDRRFDRSRILGPKQVTDAYLLALAVQHDARFVTFDASVPLRAVRGAGAEHLVVL